MEEQKTLVFVGAHPDDETFGVGATLAQYAQAGVRVFYLCGTRGEVGEVDPEYLAGYPSIGDRRWAELQCAAKVIGFTDVIHLGYRDSGMAGSPDNNHPQALSAAPVDQVAERIVAQLRRLKPQVVITFDPIGGYGHPDHIAIHNATVRAFHTSGDPLQYTSSCPAFQAQKLYFHAFPHTMLKFMVRMLKFLGRDPHHFGKNKDIDLAALVETEYPVHAVIRLNKTAIKARDEATACHISQSGGSPRRGIMGVVSWLFGQKDSFTRMYPPPGKNKEKDLFEDV